MKNRVLVITGTTDINTDPSLGEPLFKDVFDTTFSSKTNYVKMHNYDLLSLNGFGKDFFGRYRENEIGFLRIVKVFNMIEEYDYVMWIDADAMITNPSMPIENFEINESVFYCSYDWAGKYTLNTGNFILKKTVNTKLFIDAFYSISKQLNMPEEQATINFMYFNTEFKSMIKVLDHSFLNAVPSADIVKKEIWNTKPKPPFPWKENDFLVHATGLPNSERIRIFNTYFNQYL